MERLTWVHPPSDPCPALSPPLPQTSSPSSKSPLDSGWFTAELSAGRVIGRFSPLGDADDEGVALSSAAAECCCADSAAAALQLES